MYTDIYHLYTLVFDFICFIVRVVGENMNVQFNKNVYYLTRAFSSRIPYSLDVQPLFFYFLKLLIFVIPQLQAAEFTKAMVNVQFPKDYIICLAAHYRAIEKYCLSKRICWSLESGQTPTQAEVCSACNAPCSLCSWL